MQVQVQELGACKVALHVEIEADRVQKIQDKAFKEVAPYVNVPGFRRGKAPHNLIQRYMNQDLLRRHTLSLLIPNALDEAVKESGLEMFDEPDIPEEPVFVPGESLKFTAQFTTPPKVELSDYTGQRIEYLNLEVRDEDADRSLEQLLEQRSSLQPVNRPVEANDFVTIDYVAHVEGEDDSSGPMLRIAGSSENPLDQTILGHSTGETIQIEAPFHSDETKTANYEITIKEARNWGKPEPTDDFAKSIGFDTIEELREDIRQKLEIQAEEMVIDDIEQRLINMLREKATMEYPQLLIDQQAAERMETLLREIDRRKITLDEYLSREKLGLSELEGQLEESARNFVESRLVLTEAIRQQQLKITDAEIAEELGASNDQDSEVTSEKRSEAAANRIMYRKIIHFLRENNELVSLNPTAPESVEDADASSEAEKKEGGWASRLFRRKSHEENPEEAESSEESVTLAPSDEAETSEVPDAEKESEE